jgi:phenylalanyl-tRNA synthetase beta chain
MYARDKKVSPQGNKMKISYNWIKEYIDLKKSPEEIARLLTSSGSEVKIIEKIGDDNIMDIEITPNRSDCLSYIGIARELSALTGKTIKAPSLKIKKSSGKAPFTVDIKDKDLCPRYTARLIRDVKVGESPDWLKKKIVAMGLRPVNNVVDITNFVLFELGQPLHAFDYDKIEGNAVIIRRARQGEKMTSIDKIERKLEKDMLAIADREKPIALGGVMGGLDTEVTETAKNVLLESAYFKPTSVRRTSFKLALSSESSYRFERSVDPGMVLEASDRAALLIAEICGGEIGELLDKGAKPKKDKKVLLRIEHLNKILNLGLKETYIKKALTGLGLKASSTQKGILKVSIPSFRQDIKYEVDLIEEISRIYGYENIDTTIPKTVPHPERKLLPWRAKEKAVEVLTSLGLNEVITYAMLSRNSLKKVSDKLLKEAIAVKNYLSFDQEVMRPSLLPSILNVLSYNMNRGVKDLKIFEVGSVYRNNLSPENGYSETNICIVLTGLFSEGWQREKRPVTFFDLKGILEKLSFNLGLDPKKLTLNIQAPEAALRYLMMQQDKTPLVLYDGNTIGNITSLPARIRDAFDLKQEVFVTEIRLGALLHPSDKRINLDKKFKDIPKFPSIKRDISLVAGGEISFEKITSLVKGQGGELVERIEPFDEYTGKHIPRGHHGLSFRIEYRDKKKTLTAEEVDRVHSEIRKSLVEKLGITLR